ncbi:MAG: hypothetical protein A2X80_04490 [Geobacteraceae bacterium GWB2_52_12]|nr:MAG: hypothetical protein A2X80_04490 [Geobacteraceae bacterium GWB2_52_12]
MKKLVLIVAAILAAPIGATGDWVQDNMRWQEQQQQIQNRQQERVLGYSYGADNESIRKRVASEKAQAKRKRLDAALKELEIESSAVEDQYNAEKQRVIEKYTRILESINAE